MNVTIKLCKHNIDGFGSCKIMEDGVCVQGPCPAEDLVEYAPVVHGHWIPISDGAWVDCNECGEGYDVSDNGAMTVFKLFCDSYKYCPNCGAKMDGGGSDGR